MAGTELWATERLREYLIKGFTLDDERLKGHDRLADYFDGTACPYPRDTLWGVAKFEVPPVTGLERAWLNEEQQD